MGIIKEGNKVLYYFHPCLGEREGLFIPMEKIDRRVGRREENRNEKKIDRKSSILRERGK